MVAKDGRMIQVITNGIPMIGPKDELLGYRGSDRDLTQQREAEEKLRTENANTTFLTNLAIKLTNAPSKTSIGELVIPEIKKHTGAIYAWYAHFDHEEHALFFKHLEIESKMHNTILAVAGKDLLKKPSHVSKENYHKIAESKVDTYDSLHELTFGTVNEFVSKAVAAITGVTRIYAVAHVVGGKIFDFFRQADDSDTRKYGGLGIGLAISKRIANVMGGSLHVESTPGEGTVFYFSVPVSQGTKVADYQTTGNKPTVLDLQSHTILIAEDDDDSMMMVATMLKATKARLLHAENGEEALKLFEQNQDISLVLMNIKMPVMNGLQATRIIKSRKPSLPVIAFTAYSLPEETSAILDAGCDCIV